MADMSWNVTVLSLTTTVLCHAGTWVMSFLLLLLVSPFVAGCCAMTVAIGNSFWQLRCP